MSDSDFIASEKAEYTVAELCDALEVASSTYYSQVNREPSERARANALILPKIRAVYLSSLKTYGSPRVYEELRESGEAIGRHRTARLMRKNGMNARPKRSFKKTTDSNHDRGYSPNLLERNFTTDAPNQVWVADITYIRTYEGWLYLAVVIDLFARRVVGWTIDDHMRDDLVIAAQKHAISIREPEKGLVFHSDRGSQYASADFRSVLKDHGMVQSMSRKGNCWDNAVAESFFASLEKDVLLRTAFATKTEGRRCVANYIENFYNPVRRHSANGFISPVNAEREFLTPSATRRAA